MDLLALYNLLRKKYGVQNWWPSTLEGELYPAYHGGTLDRRMRYEIAVGAVLTQNTTWTNVKKAIYNLNKINLMEPKKINFSDDNLVLDAIRPSGFYNLKLKRLRNLNSWWLANAEAILGDKDKNRKVDFWRDSILSVEGIGPETGDDILLYCFELPSFVIDTYTKRIMARHFHFPENIEYEVLRKIFMDSLPEDIEMYKEYHALFVKLAKTDCTKRLCSPECPIRHSH